MHAVPGPSPDDGAATERGQVDVIGDATRLATEICEAPYAAVVMTGDPGLVAAATGFDPAPDTFGLGLADRILDAPRGLLVVDDAQGDLWLRDHPLVADGPRIRFLVSVALTGHDGSRLGFLTAMSPEPKQLGNEQAEALEALGRLLAAHIELRDIVGRLEHAVTERDRYERWLEDYQLRLEQNLAEISERSVTDPLTGLRNRRAFLDRLDEDIRRAAFEGGPIALVLLDVDEFKPFNDDFGHPAGDEVLERVAGVFADRIRSADFVARIGGDEFALVLPSTDAEGGYVLAERLRRAVERSGWSRRQITVSAGVAAADGGVDPADLLAAADKALYAAKGRGRNCVEVDAG